MNAAILSSASALLRALAGGGASLAAAVYTQRYQDRLQRNAREIAKRESVYADFITTASAIRVAALVEDGIKLGKDHQQLIGLLNRLRLFAPSFVIAEAESVIRSLMELALQPRIDLTSATLADVDRAREGEAVAAFSQMGRRDLDRLSTSLCMGDQLLHGCPGALDGRDEQRDRLRLRVAFPDRPGRPEGSGPNVRF